MSRAEKAKEYFKSGYTCSQAVVLAFSDLCGVSEEFLLKQALPFGGGIGRLRLTCGAVSGLVMAYGAIFGTSELDAEKKKTAYQEIRGLVEAVQAETGSVICADLLAGKNLAVEKGGVAEERSAEYYKKRPCADLVYLAADLLEKFLAKKGVFSA
ncbi:MAG: C_GCAxxG_C_C family protein [Clostridia bacterium]|nr:C_GCAxxG_C_C family protein [Clostridia bacterium]